MINITNVKIENEPSNNTKNFSSNYNSLNGTNTNSSNNQNSNLTFTNQNYDNMIRILKYISTLILFIQEVITNEQQFIYVIIANSIITLISLIFLIYIIISLKCEKFLVNFPIVIINYINILILEYFIGPCIQISLMTFKCTNGTHDLLKLSCFSDTTHIVFVVLALINLIYFSFISIILTIYFYEIGSITETKYYARLNTNFEIYTNLYKISIFVFAYFIKFYSNESLAIKLFLQIYLIISCCLFSFYCYNKVLYFNERINNINLIGWVFCSWFSIVIFLKTVLSFHETIIFVFIGWIILGFAIHYLTLLKEDYLLTEFVIFESKSLKDIEWFLIKLYNLINYQNLKEKTMLMGIIKKFEELLKNSHEMQEKYSKLLLNQYLKKKYNSDAAISVLSIIYVVYDHYLEKSNFKIDILFNFCYFLVNKLKNATYAAYLCSKVKSSTHKEMYLKYILMEDFKTYMICRLMKSTNKESIKRIQLGSAILFNIYCEHFKNKIYDITCNQIDYFDVLKNSLITNNTAENYLKLGEDVIRQRKEIMKLWQNIIELNPFNDDIYHDFNLYAREIIQDEILFKNETKKLNTLKSSKFSERNNTYYYLFHPNNSILLVDGYSTFGKVLYYTPNFPSLYDFSGKEVLNMTVDDLCPQVIKDFHRDIIFNGIQYTNLSIVFNRQRNLLLKGKNGNLHTIKIFIKCIPNLSNGIIYMLDITKITEKFYAILIDKNFRISSFTDFFNQGIRYEEGEGYNLDKSCINSYLFIIIPQLLINLEYSEKEGFYFDKDNFDLRGSFYNLSPNKYFVEKVEKVLNTIKQNGKLIFSDDPELHAHSYDELLDEIEKRSSSKQNVFYKVIPRYFLNKRYWYYKIILSSDLISIKDEQVDIVIKNAEKEGLYGSNNLKKKKVGDANNPEFNYQLIESNSDNITYNNKSSYKQIKLKVNYIASEEENKKFLEENEKINDEREKGRCVDNKLDKIGEEKSFSTNSNNSRTSMDSSRFNKLKNGILENKEISAIKYMKLLSVFFGIGIVILVSLASEESNMKFSNLNSYILQNLFFNHSKIAVSCIYFSTLNLKLIKNNIYTISKCSNIPCDDFYSDLLEICVSDVKIQKQNSNTFFEDFKNILFYTKKISLNIHDREEKNTILINVENNLNILISYGLTLNSNKNEYIKNPDSPFDDIVENILEQSILYINDKQISGFDEMKKQNNLKSRYLKPFNTLLIAEIIYFMILIIFFLIFIWKIYKMEKEYLKRIIYFNNAPFEAYLKNLEDIKKRLRNDTSEEEGIKGEYDANENENISDRKPTNKKKDNFINKGDESVKKGNKKSKKGNAEKDILDEDEKLGNKKNKKNSKNKVRKKKDIRMLKFQIISSFFYNTNIFFFLKIIFIIILSASYSFVINIMDQSTINNILEFDYTNNALEGVYKESFMIYLSLKTELGNYIQYELLKQNLANQLKILKQSNKTLLFENIPFSDYEDLLKYKYYKMNIPNQIDSPKIGTLLMPLTNTDLTKASKSILKLNDLYNYNACEILYDSSKLPYEYNQCSNFWSSILLKGMEQSITQMSVVITSVLDDLHSLNINSKNITQVIQEGSNFDTYEKFVQIYLLDAYQYTTQIFRDLNKSNLDNIYKIYRYIMIGYIIFGIFLFFFMLYFIHNSKYIFNTFMNFIGILPMIYLMEDIYLYKEILNLEKYL